MTPPRTDLPSVGDFIVAVHCCGHWYYGPMTVLEVDQERPRVTLHRTGIAQSGEWTEWQEIHDGGIPITGPPPFSVLHWNRVVDLNDRDREEIEEVVAALTAREPEARERAARRRKSVAAYNTARGFPDKVAELAP